jgi:hypothetical protein
MLFAELLVRHKKENLPPYNVLGIDPGGTTGLSLYIGEELGRGTVKQAQMHTSDVYRDAMQLWMYLKAAKPKIVVCEDYRVYGWKTQQHAWADLHTPRLIGALEFMCSSMKVPVVKQGAQLAKQFCTDDKLKEWGLYERGERHSRDATRHLCFYLLFGKKEDGNGR